MRGLSLSEANRKSTRVCVRRAEGKMDAPQIKSQVLCEYPISALQRRNPTCEAGCFTDRSSIEVKEMQMSERNGAA